MHETHEIIRTAVYLVQGVALVAGVIYVLSTAARQLIGAVRALTKSIDALRETMEDDPPRRKKGP